MQNQRVLPRTRSHRLQASFHYLPKSSEMNSNNVYPADHRLLIQHIGVAGMIMIIHRPRLLLCLHLCLLKSFRDLKVFMVIDDI